MNKQTNDGFARYGRYDSKRTGILIIDPYNDFLHPDGKSYSKSKEVIEKIDLLKNMSMVMRAARDLGIQLLYVPHHRAEPNDYKYWKYPTSTQLLTDERQLFAKGSWGGDFHQDLSPAPNDIIIKEHWSQNGFINTDLDFQLKQHDIDRVILIGMLANSCIEATGRMAMELGYHVTLITDGTAANSWEHMRAAHEINGPTYAHAILNTKELIHILEGKI